MRKNGKENCECREIGVVFLSGRMSCNCMGFVAVAAQERKFPCSLHHVGQVNVELGIVSIILGVCCKEEKVASRDCYVVHLQLGCRVLELVFFYFGMSRCILLGGHRKNGIFQCFEGVWVLWVGCYYGMAHGKKVN